MFKQTPSQTVGPFFHFGLLTGDENVLVNQLTHGERIYIRGQVWDGAAQPVPDALVEIWHCNENGEYDNTSDNYVYRASAKTSADGKYHFKTILPVPYAVSGTLTRPAHIHMRISAIGVQDLVTQVYFKGDKHISEDSSSSDPKSLNRILDISSNDKKVKVVKFDVYLREEYVLEAAAFKKISGLYQMNDKSMVEFYKDGDQLFAKINGQIMEALDYKGNNSFEGGLGFVKSQFEILANGGIKVKVSYLGDDKKWIEIDGTKTLKY